MSQTAFWDTGPLVALLDKREEHHAWVLEQMSRLPPHLCTCEAVIAEAFHLVRHLKQAQTAIVEMILEDVIRIPFFLREHAVEVLMLLKRYADVPMALADGCLVRMSELVTDCVVFTLDSDFRIYRRHKRQGIPLVIPPQL